MCELYYYHRNRDRVPQSTVCIISECGMTARGVAVCNDGDNFSRREGRAMARGRAIKALKNLKSSEPINYLNGRVGILLKLPPDVDPYKSEYDPYLTEFEKKLLGKVGVEA